MITATVSNTDIQNLNKKLLRLSKSIKVDVAKDLAEGALNIRNEAILRAPVDTGRLRASAYVRKKRSSGLLWSVGVNARYAPYIEFGTGKLVSLKALIGAGFPTSYADRFKGKGLRKVNIQPRPFLFPSYIAETPKMYYRIKQTLKRNGKSF